MLLSCLVAACVAVGSTGVWLITSADASVGPACTDTWTGPSSNGDWETAADWSLDAVPTSTDVACWASATTIDVGATDAATAGTLEGGSLDIDGTSSNVGQMILATADSTSTLVNLTVGIGDLEGPGGLAIAGNFVVHRGGAWCHRCPERPSQARGDQSAGNQPDRRRNL
jgi:hypothetical protein